jgi:molybdopterin molybdotransferase
MLKPRPINEVTEIIASRFGSLRMPQESVPLEDALGRVLAQDVKAGAYLPAFNRATVDGYAVKAAGIASCSAQAPVSLQLIGEVHMGQHTLFQITEGQCVYVPTGGEVPEGADAMVMIETTHDLGNGMIAFSEPTRAGLNMIFRGEDTKPGDRVLPAGKRLKIADTGTLALMGTVSVPVMKKPRVGIISTGDEIIPADQPLSGGLIRDANNPILRNAVLTNGGEPHVYGIIKDDMSEIRKTMEQAVAENDLVIVSGGTSMDSRDAIETIVTKLGEMLQHGVLLKPGKPTIVGSIAGKPVFGLPGNPVSVYFTFHLFVRPLLHSMQGTQPVDRHITLPLASDVSTVANKGREECVLVIIKNNLACPVASKSGLITTVSYADGYFRVPRELHGRDKGDLVDIIFLDQ